MSKDVLIVTPRALKRATQNNCDRVYPLLKLLSEPNRLLIFALLTGGEMCVCDIEERIAISQALVSHHLRVLREAGLIRARRDSQWVYYSIDKPSLTRIYPALCRLFNPECIDDKTSSCS